MTRMKVGSPIMSPIRIIGDATLHKPCKKFPLNCNDSETIELHKQIEIAKKRLISSGGAGIAANQCSEISIPYCFTIVGVFHDIKEHYEHAKKRYPSLEFPEAMILINPEIVESSTEQQTFSHGCLSVPSSARAEMHSPKWIRVRYNSVNLTQEVRTFYEPHAVILDHELKHILKGQVYVDVCIGEISQHDRETMFQIIQDKLPPKLNEASVEHMDPSRITFIKERADDGGFYLDKTAFLDAIQTMSLQTLDGIAQRLQPFVQTKQQQLNNEKYSPMKAKL